ncbi:oxidoreductase [Photobacterium jeanii]|uniref:Oxidoreductase n=1 Tax=Photobacterium jeanii TaxID=858640 RepID=A0A178K7W2_9GAMM|nr:SDR family NAD(P)-dependent oxidoreductase [Photobacterium jeanii]OAN13065.1 oxidoreductase [Photobacterium jeanii]PST89214.1 KR domain-containing protein [Photobacterium jeanii]
MKKTILLTGATDGIGLETAKMLVADGHHVLLHGRNPTKLADVAQTLAELNAEAIIETYIADLSHLADVVALADQVKVTHQHLDAVINNAGVFNTSAVFTDDHLDVRFAVNTVAPYLLTLELLPLLDANSRVVNLSSAAQASVDIAALAGGESIINNPMRDGDAYAQSKLALTMLSRSQGSALKGIGPMVVSVNPASMLGSKMVKDAFGVAGGDLKVGADILYRAALSDEFANAHGLYFDNDIGQFGEPHPDALNDALVVSVMKTLDDIVARVKSA